MQPLKEDNVRLLHENNALHLELIHEAEREDEAHQQLQIQAEKLKTKNQQLAFLNSQYRQKAEAAEVLTWIPAPRVHAQVNVSVHAYVHVHVHERRTSIWVELRQVSTCAFFVQNGVHVRLHVHA